MKIDLNDPVFEYEVFIHIKDSGYGIPADNLPFSFDRFYRVRSEEVKDIEGNGLGLAIVKSIVEQHGGLIRVEREPRKGSCFTFSLPLTQSELIEVSDFEINPLSK